MTPSKGRFVRRFLGGLRPGGGKRINAGSGIAAFGKHPCHDEHFFVAGGSETSALQWFYERLYQEGIKQNIDEGRWGGESSGGEMPRFDHRLVVAARTIWVIARSWPSRDQGARTVYPLVLGSTGTGPLTLDRIRQEYARLDGLHASVSGASDLAEIQALVELAAEAIGELPSVADDEFSSQDRSPDASEDLGLLRVLHRVYDETGPARPEGRRSSGCRTWRSPTGVQQRVPVGDEDVAEALHRWNGFLDGIVGDEERWAIAPLHAGWIDLVLGPADASTLGCLGFILEHEGFATEIPYVIDDLREAELRSVIAAITPGPERLTGGQDAGPDASRSRNSSMASTDGCPDSG